MKAQAAKTSAPGLPSTVAGPKRKISQYKLVAQGTNVCAAHTNMGGRRGAAARRASSSETRLKPCPDHGRDCLIDAGPDCLMCSRTDFLVEYGRRGDGLHCYLNGDIIHPNSST